MATGTVNTTVRVAGLDFSGLVSRSGDGVIAHDPTLPAGKSGTLTTRTTDTSGVVTAESDHGITTSDTVDLYWSDGCRYGMDVTAVNGNDVTISGGAGDVLPPASPPTPVVITPQVEINSDFDGDDVQIIAAHCPRRAHLDFQENGGTSIAAIELTGNEPWDWAADTGVSNPLTGNPVGKIMASCGETTDGQLKIGLIYDSTP